MSEVWIWHPGLPGQDQKVPRDALGYYATSGWRERDDQTDPVDADVEQALEAPTDAALIDVEPTNREGQGAADGSDVDDDAIATDTFAVDKTDDDPAAPAADTTTRKGR